MNKMLQFQKIKGGYALVPLMLIVGLLDACASTPKVPTAELVAADQAIANADQAGVVQYASVELAEAREKIAAARAAVQEKQMSLAERLAQESRVDAELAIAKGEAAKAAQVNEEMKKSNQVLEQEMNRKVGDSQ